MRAVVQRVREARVEVDGQVAGAIGGGLLILLGVAKSDTRQDAEYLADKLAGLRIFSDETGKMNRDVTEAGGSLLVVSQFTLYGDVRKGRRPGFERAAEPQQARVLYEYFVERIRARGVPIQTGVFQASMFVHLVNDGPVTIIVDSEK
ncbi:MAG: D-tyrosyl-tRNA(Tyr) deacylase [Acidobacteriales bacterium]|nr:MAG: D-tyrosyl-tRNA(Tyr) deacylase [Terriglobales bacterium]